MKIFGVSVLTIVIVVIAYALGASYPGPVNAVKARF